MVDTHEVNKQLKHSNPNPIQVKQAFNIIDMAFNIITYTDRSSQYNITSERGGIQLLTTV
ncbi:MULTISPECIES: hypothetical protein [Chitinophaga]|uniref:hypothetical protein n=1 Tax=Chitinophaga TaxID=79328 RepID=UPI0014557E7C|nr:hypothetical protein [Chitinophaga ginsengisegetis]MDR6567262.1 hypothetical protein [Chitinophaga ginsengisegetis]MDR6646992.1 hypothetical protein [Chitinophaga ginsengisegetis]MDR6653342.1 hypothetical protein [Chitinophaga ginsengisegetis]